jgi:hypothetical protein
MVACSTLRQLRHDTPKKATHVHQRRRRIRRITPRAAIAPQFEPPRAVIR